nr:transposase [Pseudoalteromonas sp. XMcav2-N]
MKVYGNGEWHARKHGVNQRRTWRKLHLAIDANTHQIVGAELSTISVADSEVLGDLLRPLRRKVSSVKADGAYDPRLLCRSGSQKGRRSDPSKVHRAVVEEWTCP